MHADPSWSCNEKMQELKYGMSLNKMGCFIKQHNVANLNAAQEKSRRNLTRASAAYNLIPISNLCEARSQLYVSTCVPFLEACHRRM